MSETGWFWCGLIILLLIGVGVRLTGIGWGLPGETRPDEPPYHPDEELVFVQAGKLYSDPDPIAFCWGGTLYLRSAWAVRTIVEGLGTDEAPTSFRRTLSGLRWLNVFYASLAALLLGWAGWRLFGRIGGLYAAGFLLLSPAHVLDSHFARPEVLTTLFVAASVAAAVKAVVDGDRRYIALGALCGGLAAGTMIWGVVTLPPLLVAFLEATPAERGRFRPASVAAGCAVVAAGALPGYLLGSFETFLFWDTFRLRWEQSASAHRGAFTFPWTHLGPLSCYAFGTLTVFGAWGGIVLAVLKRRPATLALASAFVGAILILGPQRGYMQRYVLWLLPFVALLAASFFRGRLLAAVGFMALVLSAFVSWNRSWSMGVPDTRQWAGISLATHTAGTGDAVGYTATYRGDHTYVPRLPAGATTPLMELRMFEEFDPDAVLRDGPRYIVVTDFARNQAGSPWARRFFELLDRGDVYRSKRKFGRVAAELCLERLLFPRPPDDLLYVDLEFEIFERK